MTTTRWEIPDLVPLSPCSVQASLMSSTHTCSISTTIPPFAVRAGPLVSWWGGTTMQLGSRPPLSLGSAGTWSVPGRRERSRRKRRRSTRTATLPGRRRREERYAGVVTGFMGFACTTWSTLQTALRHQGRFGWQNGFLSHHMNHFIVCGTYSLQVWCDGAAYPRRVPVKVSTSGDPISRVASKDEENERCACYKKEELDLPMLRVYDGCDPMSKTCVTSSSGDDGQDHDEFWTLPVMFHAWCIVQSDILTPGTAPLYIHYTIYWSMVEHGFIYGDELNHVFRMMRLTSPYCIDEWDAHNLMPNLMPTRGWSDARRVLRPL